MTPYGIIWPQSVNRLWANWHQAMTLITDDLLPTTSLLIYQNDIPMHVQYILGMK